MKLTEEQVKHVARLSNLEFSKEELKKFAKELSEILSFVERLSIVATEKIPPLAHAAGFKNVAREDETRPSLPSDEALRNAKDTYNNFIKIEAIFEEI